MVVVMLGAVQGMDAGEMPDEHDFAKTVAHLLGQIPDARVLERTKNTYS